MYRVTAAKKTEWFLAVMHMMLPMTSRSEWAREWVNCRSENTALQIRAGRKESLAKGTRKARSARALISRQASCDEPQKGLRHEQENGPSLYQAQ